MSLATFPNSEAFIPCVRPGGLTQATSTEREKETKTERYRRFWGREVVFQGRAKPLVVEDVIEKYMFTIRVEHNNIIISILHINSWKRAYEHCEFPGQIYD
jgi:hypothetical protein